MISFTFAEAITALKMGFKMRRSNWKQGYYVVIEDGKIMAVDIEMGEKKEWSGCHRHLLANDWCKYIGGEEL